MRSFTSFLSAQYAFPIVLLGACDPALDKDTEQLAAHVRALQAEDGSMFNDGGDDSVRSLPADVPDDNKITITGPEELTRLIAQYSAADPTFATKLTVGAPESLDFETLLLRALPAEQSRRPSTDYSCNQNLEDPTPAETSLLETRVKPRPSAAERAPNRDVFAYPELLKAKAGDRPTREAEARHQLFLDGRCELAKAKAAAGDMRDLAFCDGN